MKTFEEITNQMISLYNRKNNDYGNSFDKTLDEFGLVAGVIRLNDKMNRIKQLTKSNNEIKDESIEDTLIDLANYSVMILTWLSKNENKRKTDLCI